MVEVEVEVAFLASESLSFLLQATGASSKSVAERVAAQSRFKVVMVTNLISPRIPSWGPAPLHSPAMNAAVSSSPFQQVDLVLLILRLVAGPTIFWHGYNKMFRGGKIAGTARWFTSMGMRPNGTIHAYAASLTEMGCGVLLLFGFLTPLAAAGVISLMVVAGWTVHKHAFLIAKDGFEHVFLLATVCFAIGSLGAGRWSLDRAFGLSEYVGYFLGYEWLGMLITLVVGIGAGTLLLLACYRPPAKEAESNS